MPNLSSFIANTTASFVSLTANDTIQVGDLLSAASDGKVYVANDPTATYSSINLKPAVLTANVYVTNSAAITAVQPIGTGVPNYLHSSSCVLTNGNVVYAWRNAATVYFAIYNPYGVLQTTGVVTTTNPNVSDFYSTIAIGALTGGGFVVTFYDTSTFLKAAYYNNAGVLQNSGTIDSTRIAQSGSGPIAVIGLTNGNFVVLYMWYDSATTATTFIYHSAWTPTITQVVAPAVVIQGPASTYTTYELGKMWASGVALPSGGYAATFMSGGTNLRGVVFSNTLTVVSNTSLWTTGTTTPTYQAIATCITGANNVGWIAASGNSSSYISYQTGIYSNTGTVVANGSVSTITGTTASNEFAFGPPVAVASITNGTMFIVSSFNNYTIVGQLYSNGASLTATVANSSSVTGDVAAVSVGDGTAIVRYTTGVVQTFARYSGSAVLGTYTTTMGSTSEYSYVVNSGNGNFINFTAATSSPYPLQVVPLYGNTISARSPVGIAANAALATNSVLVQITGTANTRLATTLPWATTPSGTVQGQTMTIVGNTAFMQGVGTIAPLARRSIS